MTTLTTPGGMPASSAKRASSRMVAEACSDGLITMVLPAARAGANLIAVRYSGLFHGMIAATTPMASCTV
ncbi:hypothetical protein D3C76_1217420 [compost metagenome]